MRVKIPDVVLVPKEAYIDVFGSKVFPEAGTSFGFHIVFLTALVFDEQVWFARLDCERFAEKAVICQDGHCFESCVETLLTVGQRFIPDPLKLGCKQPGLSQRAAKIRDVSSEFVSVFLFHLI